MENQEPVQAVAPAVAAKPKKKKDNSMRILAGLLVGYGIYKIFFEGPETSKDPDAKE